jgi:hypothetical protein
MHPLRLLPRGIGLAVLATLLLFSASTAVAQSDFENAIGAYTTEQVEGYVQPFADLFSANLNSGHYYYAGIPRAGLTLRLEVIPMWALVGDDQKSYDLPLPPGYSASTMKAPTVFGDPAGASYTDPGSGLTYYSSGGIIKASMLPFIVPQLRVGSVLGTEATVRWMSTAPFSTESFPKTTIFGFSVRHSISQWFDVLPLDIAAGYFYNSMTTTDLLDFNSSAFGLQAGKSFGIVGVYGGLQWETGTMKVSYTYTGGASPSTASTELETANSFRFTAGASLSFGFMWIFADANFSAVTNFSGGVAFGI